MGKDGQRVMSQPQGKSHPEAQNTTSESNLTSSSHKSTETSILSQRLSRELPQAHKS